MPPPRDPWLPLLLTPLREARTVLRIARLWRVETRLQSAYLLRLPAWFIYRERKAAGLFRFEDESFFFGETPYDVAADICAEAGLGAADTLVDLGCGRGKMVFTAHLARGCRAVGVDLLPTYIIHGQAIARAEHLGAVRFERTSVLDIELDDATAVYVNGWTFSDDLAGGLQARISMLADDTWWISVGRPWRHRRLSLVKQRRYPFSWGYADVFFYRVGPAGSPLVAGADDGPSFADVLSATLTTPSAPDEETP